MAIYRLAVIIRRDFRDGDFLVVRQNPPPKLPEEEYQNYVDSDLWDLPSAPLNPLGDESQSSIVIDGSESCADKLNLRLFDLDSALHQVLSQVGLGKLIGGNWAFWKFVEESEFGPEPLVHSVFILGKLKAEDEALQELTQWMSVQSGQDLLLEVRPGNNRIGPLVVMGLLTDSAQPRMWKLPQTLHCQEYPPGVIAVPMRSRTGKPFRTTNLVVIASDNVSNGCGGSSFAACGDALLIDPGCHYDCHGELMEIVAALPRKLVVFVTHHHYDHIDGLSVIQKCNPEANLIAHENTMRRIGKDHWSLGYTPVSGGEEICIAGQRLEVIFAPGHTDGHMALLHVSTHSLIVGDHCVGQGSAVLDITSGGNMTDYFQTTYKFLEVSPHALIPMHGRVNMWPKRMLCGYLKHRRERETSILNAIENGAETLFDILSKSYADIDSWLWIPASSNVRLHVDHLAHQNKLPKGFSLEKFHSSYEEFMAKMDSGDVAKWAKAHM
ncbi:metallo-hydrolase/oxidoreductase superfamily protein isoform X2 [Tasmannia lanceolata]|uniref:metallo-hydrolase/oxidoreductase superfamily protein isoform X2 n=1 Tax=Tasmannia lanceolata TaxID=3420 RepID=UPI0040629D1E